MDGDGHINPKEIRTVMRDVGVNLTADEIKKLIASVDADGNGMVRKHARASDLPASRCQCDVVRHSGSV